MNELEGMINGILSNPDEMKKIMDIASSVMGGNAAESKPPVVEEDTAQMPDMSGLLSGLSKLPGGIASVAQKLFGGAMSGSGLMGGSGDKTALLEAMRPWLSEKRKGKLETAMRVAKVMKVAGAAFFKSGG